VDLGKIYISHVAMNSRRRSALQYSNLAELFVIHWIAYFAESLFPICPPVQSTHWILTTSLFSILPIVGTGDRHSCQPGPILSCASCCGLEEISWLERILMEGEDSSKLRTVRMPAILSPIVSLCLKTTIKVCDRSIHVNKATSQLLYPTPPSLRV
jgi:hypothetical protein